MRWTKDEKVEAFLRSRGIPFEVEQRIPLSSIDREEGMRKQVRLIKNLMEDVVLRYALAMEKPEAAFPRPILQREKKRLWPWSGNHRLGALDLCDLGDQEKLVDAYVVEVYDPVMMDLLPRVINNLEAAVGLSREELIINALFMVEKHGWSKEDAAREFGLKKEQLWRYGLVEEAKRKITSLGVPINGFADTTLADIHTIKNANSMRDTALLLHKFKVKGKEAQAIISDVKRGETEAEQEEEIEKWKKTLSDRIKSTKKKTGVKITAKEKNRERLLKLLTGLSRYLEMVKTYTAAQITDPVHQQIVLEHWKKIQSGMVRLLQGK